MRSRAVPGARDPRVERGEGGVDCQVVLAFNFFPPAPPGSPSALRRRRAPLLRGAIRLWPRPRPCSVGGATRRAGQLSPRWPAARRINACRDDGGRAARVATGRRRRPARRTAPVLAIERPTATLRYQRAGLLLPAGLATKKGRSLAVFGVELLAQFCRAKNNRVRSCRALAVRPSLRVTAHGAWRAGVQKHLGHAFARWSNEVVLDASPAPKASALQRAATFSGPRPGRTDGGGGSSGKQRIVRSL